KLLWVAVLGAVAVALRRWRGRAVGAGLLLLVPMGLGAGVSGYAVYLASLAWALAWMAGDRQSRGLCGWIWLPSVVASFWSAVLSDSGFWNVSLMLLPACLLCGVLVFRMADTTTRHPAVPVVSWCLVGLAFIGLEKNPF